MVTRYTAWRGLYAKVADSDQAIVPNPTLALAGHVRDPGFLEQNGPFLGFRQVMISFRMHTNPATPNLALVPVRSR